MTDCTNAEIRDRLPDLAHGRLDSAERSHVEAHVASCADCAAELEVIRVAAAALARVPSVDVAGVVAALPGAKTLSRRRVVTPRVVWLAAAVAIAVVGVGLSQVVRNAVPAQVAVATAVTAPRQATSGLTLVGGMDALSADDLETLVAELESLTATLSSEPDPISMPATGAEQGA